MVTLLLAALLQTTPAPAPSLDVINESYDVVVSCRLSTDATLTSCQLKEGHTLTEVVRVLVRSVEQAQEALSQSTQSKTTLVFVPKAASWEVLGLLHVYRVLGDPPIGSYGYLVHFNVYEARCGIDLMHGVDFATGSEARKYVETRCAR